MTDQTTQTNGAQAPVFATWEDLSTPRIKTVDIASVGRSVQYLSFVPLDKLIELQSRYRIGTPAADRMGFMAEVLKFIMVSPPVTSIEQARAALKSSGPVIMGIVNEVIAPKDFEQAEMTAEIAKASPDSSSSAAG